MPGRNRPQTVQPTVTLQSVVGTLRNNTSTESEISEEDGDNYELRPRGKERAKRSTSRDRLDDTVYLTRAIQEADTLNSIALQYCCTVADIKRINGLINDQDFFALRCVKIPVKRFSLLTETHGSFVANQVLYPPATQDAAEVQEQACLLSSKSAGSYLQDIDRNIEQIVQSTDSSRGSLNEVVSSFSTQQPYLEKDRKTVLHKDPYYGADWGIGWWTAVVIMLIVGIVTPIFYLLYYEVLIKADVGHHPTTTLTNQVVLQDLPVQETVHDIDITTVNKEHAPLNHGIDAFHQHQS
ncbi:lysM and putative peptidoglycan-binding domain-containing protein 3 [Protopterus annectens]|uniref:lysM and putative peptidoglycan-binding domain-containing protein 3 n=1 Tax=Protopterus annectens TaxID=7888 RepID=UPI001CF976DF|nr:lysM and putative peptidoglycan-binding domain-containing protein 3 [Protopterus annectens]